MKPFILFLLFGSQAFAQGVIRTEFNGIPYTCTADSSTPQNPGEGAAACAAAAYHGPFSQEQSIALC
ncbi:MAG: hypothetical protein H7333_01525, partial [Bdellovibrionales bacterium]|nr:hypothetical protein [Oligoflexia bacterium]